MHQQPGKLARLLAQQLGLLRRWQQLAVPWSAGTVAGAGQHQVTDAAGRAPWCLQFTAAYRATIENQGKSAKAKAKSVARAGDAETAAASQQPADSTTTTGGVLHGQAEHQFGALPSVGKSLLRTSCPSSQLTTEHIGNYYSLQAKLLPEAFPALHHTFLAPRTGTEHVRSGGCLGLQKEQQAVSLTVPATAPLLMHRQVMEGLWQLLQRGVAAASPAGDQAAGLPARLLLQGPTGCGKSCAVVALVERARASGWLCLYIPSAIALTKGGLFVARPADSESQATQQWDTPIAAQHILLGMQQAHGAQLATLPVQLSSTQHLMQPAGEAGRTTGAATTADAAGGTADSAPTEKTDSGQKHGPGTTLSQLITHGLAAQDAHTPVDTVQALIAELSALASPSQPVLLAVDDYNALYGPTGYGKHIRIENEQTGASCVKRVPLKVKELRLANAMRLLQQPASHLSPGVQVVAAMSHTGGLSQLTEVPVGPEYSPASTAVHMPRYSQVEVAHAMYHYYECGVSSQPPTSKSVNRALLLTNGNAAELRQLAAISPLLSRTTLPAVVL